MKPVGFLPNQTQLEQPEDCELYLAQDEMHIHGILLLIPDHLHSAGFSLRSLFCATCTNLSKDAAISCLKIHFRAMINIRCMNTDVSKEARRPVMGFN